MRVFACVRACVRACGCVRACVHVSVCVYFFFSFQASVILQFGTKERGGGGGGKQIATYLCVLFFWISLKTANVTIMRQILARSKHHIQNYRWVTVFVFVFVFVLPNLHM